MRQTLFRIPLDDPWSLGPLGDVPGFGFGIVLAFWVLAGALWVWLYRRELRLSAGLVVPVAVWLIIAVAIVYLPEWMQSEHDRAIAAANRALRQQPESAAAYVARARAWRDKREFGKAVDDYRAAARIQPGFVAAHRELAWLLATCPDGQTRDGDEAVELAIEACELADYRDPRCHDTLAAAYAETGRFDEAIDHAKQAALLASGWANGGIGPDFSGIRQRLGQYVQERPFRERAAVTAIPVRGYGFMLVVGFFAAVVTAGWLARRAGLDSNLILDVAVWMFFAGIAGARLFYCIQYSERVFYENIDGQLVLKSLPQVFFSAINLPDGGLVLLGGVLAAAAMFFGFCYVKRQKPLLLADILIPAFFVGLGFGRLGCFLNGCCYGDRCELPWAVMFPLGSVPDIALVSRGLAGPAETASLWLHPSQIYSSINGFILAFLTASYFTYRPRDGSVLALGMLVYPVTRFTIEYLRGDELAQLNTPFTISQLVSLGLFAVGLVYVAWLSRRANVASGPQSSGDQVPSAA